jgi:hypothetical protein
MLASALAWIRYLRTGRVSAYVLALCGAVFAMGCKEDCVLLAPLLIGLDLAVCGRGAFSRRALARYAPFALLGAAYLALALDPSAIADREYSLRSSLVARLAANFAALFWPRDVDALPPAAAWLGAGLLVALAAAARWGELERRWIALGTVVALCGLLPVLPAPDDMPIAGTRNAYPSAIGVAFLAAGLFELAWRRGALPPARLALAAGFAGWIAVQVAAVRSIERWRYQRHCHRFASLLDATRVEVLAHATAGEAVVIAPDIWNVLDYRCALSVFLGVEPSGVRIEDASLEALAESLLAGGELDPTSVAVFVSPADAAIARISSPAEVPWQRWQQVADVQADRGLGRTVPVVRISASH